MAPTTNYAREVEYKNEGKVLPRNEKETPRQDGGDVYIGSLGLVCTEKCTEKLLLFSTLNR